MLAGMLAMPPFNFTSAMQVLPRTSMPLEAYYCKMVQQPQAMDDGDGAEGSLYAELYKW